MFNVCIEPSVLKTLKKEGYNWEFCVNKIIMRTKEGRLSFEIIYNNDNYELFAFAKNDFCYATSITIEFDKIKKCPILITQAKHKETTVYKTIICYSD